MTHQMPFLAGLSQPFVRLGTLRGMSDVAGKLAVAKKAVVEMLDIEATLLTVGVDQDQMNQAMTDVAELAGFASGAAEEAIKILKKMSPEVERFLSEAEREMSERAEPEEVEDGSN